MTRYTNRMTASAVVIFMALGGGWIWAAEIAVETFESYTAGNDLNATGGGSGWTNNWAGGVGEVTVASGVIPERGQSMRVTDDGSTDPIITRSFPAQTGTVYLGFLLRKSTAFDVEDLLLVYLDHGGGYANGASTGIKNGGNQFLVRVSSGETGGPIAVADNTYQVVLKISKSVPGNYNTGEVFLNQPFEGRAISSNTDDANTDTLSRLAIRAHDGGGTAGVGPLHIDELRIATNYAEALVPSLAGDTVVSAAIVEDAYIESNAPTTPRNNGGDSYGVYVRNHPSVTRAGFVQFTLPQLGSGEDVSQATFSGFGFSSTGSNDAPVTVGLSVNPDLTNLSWNDAVTANIITGRDGSDSRVLWGTAATVFPNAFPGQVIKYGETSLTDTTPEDGLLKFVKDNISAAGPVTVTLGIGGPVGNSNYTCQWYNREATDSLWAGVWAPQLALTLELPPKGTTVSIH